MKVVAWGATSENIQKEDAYKHPLWVGLVGKCADSYTDLKNESFYSLILFFRYILYFRRKNYFVLIYLSYIRT